VLLASFGRISLCAGIMFGCRGREYAAIGVAFHGTSITKGKHDVGVSGDED
jgi:hypothetical protein